MKEHAEIISKQMLACLPPRSKDPHCKFTRIAEHNIARRIYAAIIHYIEEAGIGE